MCFAGNAKCIHIHTPWIRPSGLLPFIMRTSISSSFGSIHIPMARWPQVKYCFRKSFFVRCQEMFIAVLFLFHYLLSHVSNIFSISCSRRETPTTTLNHFLFSLFPFYSIYARNDHCIFLSQNSPLNLFSSKHPSFNSRSFNPFLFKTNTFFFRRRMSGSTLSSFSRLVPYHTSLLVCSLPLAAQTHAMKFICIELNSKCIFSTNSLIISALLSLSLSLSLSIYIYIYIYLSIYLT